MKCKLMSLLMVIGLIGCKAETGTVMYVVKAPLPDTSCVYGETATGVRLNTSFDPTQADDMGLVLSVHNGLNAKDTDMRVDDNGVNIRPDANHIQLEKAHVCYFNDVATAEADVEGKCTTAGGTFQEEVAVFGTLLAESSSTPDSGTNILVNLLGSEAQAAIGGDFEMNNSALLSEDSPTTAKYNSCKAVGVSVTGVADATCSPEISRTYISGFTGSLLVIVKITLSGQTVSGTAVESSPFLLPVEIVPGAAIRKTAAERGPCTEEKVICSAEQPYCEWLSAAGNRMLGRCSATTTASADIYKNGCLITERLNDDVITTASEVVACVFRKRGNFPKMSVCEPELLGGEPEDYRCTKYEGDFACDDVDEVLVGDKCGDGLVTGAETCDDGNVESGDGCSATCTIETP